MQKTMAEWKSEQPEILESEEESDSSVQQSDISLDESTQEQAELVASRKRLVAFELEDRNKKLTNKCTELDVLEEKIECISQQSGAGRMLSSSPSSMHYTSHSACAITMSRKEEGNAYID